MTVLQKLQVRQSEIRETINGLLGNDARTEEQDGELVKLTAEGQKIEPEIRAAWLPSPTRRRQSLTPATPRRESGLRFVVRPAWPTFSLLLSGDVRYPALHGSTLTPVESHRSAGCRWSYSGTANRNTVPSQRPPQLTAQSKRQFPTCSSDPPPQVSVSPCRRTAQVRCRFHG